MLNIRLEGLDEIKDSLLRVRTNTKLPARVMKKIADTLERNIRKRTSQGIDAEGRAFAPYSKDYAKKRDKEGRPAHIVDLEFTGAMLRGLKSSINEDKGEVVLHFPDPEQALKASFHNEQGAGKNKVMRRFFELSHTDIEDVKKIVTDHVVEVVKKTFRSA